MKRYLLINLAVMFSIAAMAQKPDFSLVGFGTGTVGGTGGTTVTVSSYDQLAANVTGTDKKIIKVSGTITGPGGGVILDVGSNKSIIGVGSTAAINLVNLHLKNSQQIIIQNIKFSMVGTSLPGSDADMISVETTSSSEIKYIWIDHCEFSNETPTLPETAAKKDKYDGMIDIKRSSSLITISWNYFHDHWKCSLIGSTATDTYDRKITYHHNHFQRIKSRAPSYRGGTGHIYNNYFEGLNDVNAPTSEGVNSREEACLKVENNYFRHYSKTIYCALDDVTLEGYAYGTGNIFVDSPGLTAKTCSSFNPPYSYKMDKGDDVPCIVSSWAGVGKLDAQAYSLTTSVIGQGTILVDSSCAGGNFAAGSKVTLTAVPASGYKFVKWTGGLTGSANPADLTIDAAKSVTAQFESGTLGIEEEQTGAGSFRLYPSPVQGTVFVDVQSSEGASSQLVIRDNLGQIVHEESKSLSVGTNTLQLNLSHLPAGIYHCVLQNGKNMVSRMFVKK